LTPAAHFATRTFLSCGFAPFFVSSRLRGN
jgi:hypothetical protein